MKALRVVKLFGREEGRLMTVCLTVPAEEAPANYVPAAAVIRRVQALFGITGRKEGVGGSFKSDVKAPGSTLGIAFETVVT